MPHEAAYSVPADQPRKISIDSIATEGFIQRVGKDQHNKVGVPSNVHYAGWFTDSVKPGNQGLSVIDGHVSSRYGSALFAKLGSLRKDDVIKVEFGDYSIQRFKVVESRELPEASAADFLLSKSNDIDKQLNIITCGGKFNKKLSQYNNRIVVVTERVE